MRLGLLGGTFNPPHVGHLVCAQEAHEALGLDRVLLVPARVPPHKEVPDDPGVVRRMAMCEAAVAGDPRLAVSTADAERAGPSYTVELLRALGDRDALWFIVGGDQAHGLPDWREPEAVLALARLAVAEREGIARTAIAERLAGLAGAGERVDFFAMPRMDVSSSEIRRRLASGWPVRYLVPDAVLELIEREGLYRGAAAGGVSLGGST